MKIPTKQGMFTQIYISPVKMMFMLMCGIRKQKHSIYRDTFVLF